MNQIRVGHRNVLARQTRQLLGEARKEALLSEALGCAVQETGLTLRRMQKQTGLSASIQSRFLCGERALTSATMDALSPVLIFGIQPWKRSQRSR